MSRDYAMLWELAKTQSVVCVVDYGMTSAITSRDVAHTISRPDTGWVAICARGIEYVSAENWRDFAYRCAKENVEFVLPATDDPDIRNARGYAAIHKTRVWLSYEQFAVGELLLRLADKLEVNP